MRARHLDTHHRLETPADPLPDGFENGEVPPALCDSRFPTVPPSPMQGFWRATPTNQGWLVSCPCCVSGWAAVVPVEGGGFELFTPPGCSAGCDEQAMREHHAFHLGIVLPELQIARTEQSRSYCRAALLRARERVARDPRTVNREAFGIGRLLPAAGVSARAAAFALAEAAGADPSDLLPHVQAGTTRPWRR